MFIKLTGATEDKAIFIFCDRITGFAEGDGDTEVFVQDLRIPLSWHVKETPEQIMALIEGKTETPAAALLDASSYDKGRRDAYKVALHTIEMIRQGVVGESNGDGSVESIYFKARAAGVMSCWNAVASLNSFPDLSPKTPIVQQKCECGCSHMPGHNDDGACGKFQKGNNGRCLRCDHAPRCHVTAV